MKPHTLLFFAFVTVLAAQDKPKDPFIKDKKAASAPVVTADTPKNILCLIETITLKQRDYVELIDSPQDREKLHEHVLAAVKSGSAKLDGCHLITTKSGTRSNSEAVDELIYPTEWSTADRAGLQYPRAFEMRQLGDRFEFEPVLDEKGAALDITHAFTRDRFLGFRMVKADATLPGVPVSDFIEQQGPSNGHVIPGVPVLIATLSNAQPDTITLVFATVQVVGITAPAVPVPKGGGNLMMTARVISLDRMKGWELLRRHASDGAACMAELKPLLAAKEALLEHVATISTKPGVRSVHQSGPLYYYGTEFHPPTEGTPAEPSNDPKKPGAPAQPLALAGTTAFDCRSLGFRWELECVLNSEGTVADVVISHSNTRMTGNLKDNNWNEHYPEIPLFSTQRVTTGYTQAIGSTALIGTLNPPGDTGANEHKDDGRLWLLLMDSNME